LHLEDIWAVVIPAKAGIQVVLDSRLRGNDNTNARLKTYFENLKNKLIWLACFALLGAALLMLPFLGLFITAISGALTSLDSLTHQVQTVLPGYAFNSFMLCVLVALGVITLGLLTALIIGVFEFPTRRFAQWAVVLPMAAPAYVLAYAWADMGLAATPRFDLRNLWGAAFVLTLALYPYVYLLVRASLAQLNSHAWDAARALGSSLMDRLWRVLIPSVRPAVAGGATLAVMEVLADYGVSAYFGVPTLSTGIYQAWLAMFDWAAAAQLAVLLLIAVFMLLWLERRTRQHKRFSQSAAQRPFERVRLHGRQALVAVVLVWSPFCLGFALPVAWLIKLWWRSLQSGVLTADYFSRFMQWALNTFTLAFAAACITFALAAALVVASRMAPLAWARIASRAAYGVSLGYALPGAVIAVAILMPCVALQAAGFEGASVWVTGTLLGVLFAYSVRFTAVALQPLQAGYTQVSPRVDESAQTLGASPTRIVWQLHAPLMRASLLTAWLVVFVDTMKELPATLLLRPFGRDTLAVVAHQFAKDERLAEAALPALCIVLLGLLPLVLMIRYSTGYNAASEGK
jgi:iron(III) transport system permease protein